MSSSDSSSSNSEQGNESELESLDDWGKRPYSIAMSDDEEPEIFCAEGINVRGPHSLEELRRMLTIGELKKYQYSWSQRVMREFRRKVYPDNDETVGYQALLRKHYRRLGIELK